MIIVQALYFLKLHGMQKINLFINNINPSSHHGQVVGTYVQHVRHSSQDFFSKVTWSLVQVGH